MEHVKLSATNAQYAIVVPILSAPRLDKLWLTSDTRDVSAFLGDTPFGDVLAFDYETNGTKWHSDSSFKIVTVGLSSSVGSLSLDTRRLTQEAIAALLRRIFNYSSGRCLQLTAHNLMFEAGVTAAYGISFGEAGWVWDSLGLYMQLANEGFIGQRYGLKNAEKDMLGWVDTNEEALDIWLVRNNYCKPLKPLLSEDEREALYHSRNAKGQRKLRPNKGQMFNAPHEVLGHYNALDVDATYQLMNDVLLPATRRVPPQLVEYHREIFLQNIEILVDLAMTGIAVNRVCLDSYNQELAIKLREQLIAIRSHEKIAPIMRELELPKQIKNEPEKFLRNKKEQTISKNWLRWEEQRAAIELYKSDAIVTPGMEKVVKKHTFNLQSPKQLIQLIYGHLVAYTVVRPHSNAGSRGVIKLEGSEVEITMTKSGGLPANKALFKQLGDMGKIFNRLVKTIKEKSTVERTLSFIAASPDGRLRPTFRIPGTVTGRLAGTDKFNWQNLPNSEPYLKAFVADEGWQIIQSDFSALEPHCLAEISQDRMYMSLFGPEADGKNFDIYLHIGCSIDRMKGEILKHYSLTGNTPEQLDAAKAACAKQRKQLKLLQLASSYGAQAFKIWQTMRLDGLEVSVKEVEEIVEDYWSDKVFGGVKVFERALLEQWRENGGWVINGIGRPIAVADSKKKDLLNRIIQSQGHDILQLFLVMLRDNMRAAKIKVRWIIPDLHDEPIYSVPEAFAEQALQIHRDTVQQLNLLLDGVVKFKMTPKKMNSLADRKD